MAGRRKKGRPVSGWLVLDKPVGMTSTQAVSVIKRLYNAQKCGHGGTLDPLASGCLPIALGEATKAMPHVTDSAKSYRFTVRWGIETNTDDTEGVATSTSDKRPDQAAIEAALPDFTGEIEQMPPRFSAIKIAGERAYDLARSGEEPELVARLVVVDRFELVTMPDADHAVFEVDCGKGTYVRSLARDLGRALGCYGHVSELRRLSVGPFAESTMIPLDDVRAAAESDEGCDPLLGPVESALGHLSSVTLHQSDAIQVRRGQSVLLRGADVPVPGPAFALGGGQLLAIGEIAAGEFHPKRVFHL